MDAEALLQDLGKEEVKGQELMNQLQQAAQAGQHLLKKAAQLEQENLALKQERLKRGSGRFSHGRCSLARRNSAHSLAEEYEADLQRLERENKELTDRLHQLERETHALSHQNEVLLAAEGAEGERSEPRKPPPTMDTTVHSVIQNLKEQELQAELDEQRGHVWELQCQHEEDADRSSELQRQIAVLKGELHEQEVLLKMEHERCQTLQAQMRRVTDAVENERRIQHEVTARLKDEIQQHKVIGRFRNAKNLILSSSASEAASRSGAESVDAPGPLEWPPPSSDDEEFGACAGENVGNSLAAELADTRASTRDFRGSMTPLVRTVPVVDPEALRSGLEAAKGQLVAAAEGWGRERAARAAQEARMEEVGRELAESAARRGELERSSEALRTETGELQRQLARSQGLEREESAAAAECRSRLDELAARTADEVQDLQARLEASASSALRREQESEREIGELHLQCQRLHDQSLRLWDSVRDSRAISEEHQEEVLLAARCSVVAAQQQEQHRQVVAELEREAEHLQAQLRRKQELESEASRLQAQVLAAEERGEVFQEEAARARHAAGVEREEQLLVTIGQLREEVAQQRAAATAAGEHHDREVEQRAEQALHRESVVLKRQVECESRALHSAEEELQQRAVEFEHGAAEQEGRITCIEHRCSRAEAAEQEALETIHRFQEKANLVPELQREVERLQAQLAGHERVEREARKSVKKWQEQSRGVGELQAVVQQLRGKLSSSQQAAREGRKLQRMVKDLQHEIKEVHRRLVRSEESERRTRKGADLEQVRLLTAMRHFDWDLQDSF